MSLGSDRQLTLGVGLREGHVFENFVCGQNAAALAAVQAIFDGPLTPLVYLFGDAGTGKTHLLEALCSEGARRNKRVAYVSLKQRESLRPEMLSGLDSADLICVDDIHAVAAEPVWEEAIFHLYNQLDAARVPMIVAADRPPLKAGWNLKDLASRLASGATFEILPLDDAGRAQVLRQTARLRGFEFPEEAVNYVLHRKSRDMHSLMRILDQLDQHSLAHQRKVTVPLVREVLSRQHD